MIEWLIKALIVGLFLWIFWNIFQPKYAFVIHIKRGQPTIGKGRVPRAFLGRVATVCQDGGVVKGWIGGVRQGRRIALRFSRQFPVGPQQRLRNEWVLAD